MTKPRVGTTKSGWCLVDQPDQHAKCPSQTCTCPCHGKEG